MSTDNLAGAAGLSASLTRLRYEDWGNEGEGDPLFVPEVDEIRVSPVVARKGYLNILHEKSNGWIKKYVVRMGYLEYVSLY